MSDNYRIETIAIHAGVEPDPTTGAIMTPIYQTSTYVQTAPAEHKGYEYSRTDNPTRTALQTAIAALEGAQYGLAFSSGLAATDALLRLFNPGDHIICGDDVYGGTFRLFDKILRRYGLTFSYIDLADLDMVKDSIRPETRMIWLESPTNPLLKLADIKAIGDLTPDNVLVTVDNTFASPCLQRPLELGADIAMHSTTKFISGHSDVIGGALVMNDSDLYEQLKFLQNAIGAIPAPLDCFLTLRGIKTLPLRMGRHSENALAVAQYLEGHGAFSQVIYPGLPSHPQHELARRQMKQFGGMVSAVLAGGNSAAQSFVRRTKLFSLAESLGGVESLIEIPYTMTHASTVESELAVDPGLVRISVGVEHIDDLIADLEQALD